MTIVVWALGAYVTVGAAYWCLSLLLAIRVVRNVRLLRDLEPPAPARWPRVAHICPARDEAAAIEAAVRSRLADDYPELEIVLIDDRSTDATGEIVDRLAAADPRVRALHIRELPDGWVGKPYALQRGIELATGEWLLLSDADVHVAPGALRKAVAHALARELDHVAILPELWSASFVLDVLLAAFARLLAITTRMWAVADPRSRAAVGVGAFNLVRRSAYERTEGFEWLRLEIVDDMTLAQMLKRAGARPAVLNGRGLVGLTWYRSLGEAARGAEKSTFSALGRFSFAGLVARSLVLMLVEIGPWVGAVAALFLASGGSAAAGFLGLASALGLLVSIVAQYLPWRWIGG
ncbi:MAG: glycosyltransferase, partial [Planctomycetota bacterium]